MNKDFRDRAHPGHRQGGHSSTPRLRRLGARANSFVMPGIPGYQEDLDPYPSILTRPRRTWPRPSRPGRVQRRESRQAEVRLQHRRRPRAACRVPGRGLAQAFGLETEQIGSDFSVFLQTRTAGDYTSRATPGAPTTRTRTTSSALFVCGGGNNDVQYCNPDFDALIAQAAGEPDQDKQVALYNQAQKLLMRTTRRLLPLARRDLRGPAVRRGITGAVRLASARRPVLRDHVHQEHWRATGRLSGAGRWAGQTGPPDHPFEAG